MYLSKLKLKYNVYFYNYDILSSFCKSIIRLGRVDTIVSVSYTHLDVYKRQLLESQDEVTTKQHLANYRRKKTPQVVWFAFSGKDY